MEAKGCDDCGPRPLLLAAWLSGAGQGAGMAKRVGLGPEEQGEDERRVEEGEADYPDLVRRAWVQPLT